LVLDRRHGALGPPVHAFGDVDARRVVPVAAAVADRAGARGDELPRGVAGVPPERQRRHGVRGEELLAGEVSERGLTELVREPEPVRGLDELHVPAVHLEPAQPLRGGHVCTVVRGLPRAEPVHHEHVLDVHAAGGGRAGQEEAGA
jgi:hypothetical protein